MKKATLYSRSRRNPAAAQVPQPQDGTASGAEAEPAPAAAPATPPPGGRLARWLRRRATPVAAVGGALLASLAMLLVLGARAPGLVVTQDDIDKAVRTSLEKAPLPSKAARAYEAVRQSVVRVVGLLDESDTGEGDGEQRAMERSLGTGVVIIDDGTILTNLHVVWGAKKVKVKFHDGLESEAHVVATQPENDLAVLKAVRKPAELEPAVMTSTGDLRPGDEVIAVGLPFGIGPSVSAGVVSGLNREFRSPEGDKKLTNLIQFDAAANPGNSGGPLVTMEGHVVGIVTAILNPSEQRTFIGIGFAVPIENAAAAAGLPPF